MDLGLKDRVAIVTGGNRGIGYAISSELLKEGAHVVVASLDPTRNADAIAKLKSQSNGRVVGIPTDLNDATAVDNLFKKALAEFGRLDILINNAGVGTAVPALRETPEQFRGVIEVNLLGAFWMAQACARLMPPGSSIVNVASVLGLVKSYAPQAAYAASKAAVIGLTRDLSQQWAGRKGIRVNAIAPGYFESEMTAATDQDKLSAFIDQTASIKRFGKQHELDAAAVFLASDAASYITGITLAVDGGMSTH